MTQNLYNLKGLSFYVFLSSLFFELTLFVPQLINEVSCLFFP